MNIKTVTAAITAASLLAACAAPSQPMLDAAQQRCIQGDQQGCREVPFYQSVVNREKQEQADKAAAALAVLGAGLAAGAAAYGAASTPHYYYTPVIVCRWGC